MGFSPEDRLLYESQAAELIRERLFSFLGDYLGVSKDKLAADPSLARDSKLDSLDVAELMMELEEMDARG